MKHNNKVEKYLINCNYTLLQCLEVMDRHYVKLLIIVEKDVFISLLSIGDIQRAIVNGVGLNEPVKDHLRPNVRVAYQEESSASIRDRMIEFRMEYCPVISANGRIEDVIFWEDLSVDEEIIALPQISVPVVIMAGGKGTRLKPLTNIIPKPMVPFGDKSMIKSIIERFLLNGCSDFYVSGNYMFEMLKLHLENIELPVNVELLKESVPTGSGGSLALFREKIKSTFIVTNCDIVVDDEYFKFLDYHKERGNDVTIITSLKSYTIPYGTVESSPDGVLVDFNEKPKLNYQINTGLYILEPSVFDFVQDDTFIHITDIISSIKESGGKIGVFPVSEKSWRDIGEWNLFVNESLIKREYE